MIVVIKLTFHSRIKYAIAVFRFYSSRFLLDVEMQTEISWVFTAWKVDVKQKASEMPPFVEHVYLTILTGVLKVI